MWPSWPLFLTVIVCVIGFIAMTLIVYLVAVIVMVCDRHCTGLDKLPQCVTSHSG